MSGVVLRCSNCGTVQASTGECEACHEAQVRYFCTNHTPGLWLDAPACPICGARFGEVVPTPTSTAPRPSADRPAPPRPLPERAHPAPEHDEAAGAWDTPPSRSPDSDVFGGFRPLTAGMLLEALTYAARARSLRKGRVDDAGAPVRNSGGGCVRRLLLLALLLAALFVLVPLLLGGALLQML
jgi:hypothetical protein